MVLNYTNKHEISNILAKMKNKKSSGHDGISNEILKCCSPVIENYLTNCFNNSIEKQFFPNSLKLAKVIPLYKNGNANDPGNYRPISLLSSLSKVFEKLLYIRMVSFFNKKGLFTTKQYGFRSRKSCAQAITKITDYMRRELDQKSSGQVCFIDLQKAFDSLNHEILLEKLKNYGYRGPIHNILADYLSQRFQYVSIRKTNSPLREIRTGVPQGSIPGPFLFLVYINDLPDVCQKSEIAIFADDTSIGKAGKTHDCSVQNELETLTDWFNYNKLSINTSKCESISFGRMYQRQLPIMEKKISQKNCCKYLGLYIDPVLTFRDHINHVVNKLNKFCGLFYRVRDLYPIKALLSFYNSYAKSGISYGLIVYGRAAKTNLQNIEMAQRRIIRAIFFKEKRDSIKDILRDTEVNTVFELFIVDVFREIFSQLRSDEKNESYYKVRTVKKHSQI